MLTTLFLPDGTPLILNQPLLELPPNTMSTHLPSADVSSVFPPFVVEHLNGALLLQLEDGQRELVPPLGALGCRDPVPLGVE